jgi:hypothetical protein
MGHNVQKLNVEDQGCSGRNVGPATPVAIAHVGRTGELSLFSDLHPWNPFSPAAHDTLKKKLCRLILLV